MELAIKVTHANRTVNVYYDPEPPNPRKEWDNGTIMVHWHRRYDLGDKQVEPCTAEELKEEYLERGDPILAILPLYLYDHSGLSVSTDAFSCMWDSGQVGWVFTTESKAKEMGWDTIEKPEYEEYIKREVKSYNDCLTGQVFGYEVVGKDGDVLESCWGFVGDMEGCLSEGKAAAEGSEDPAVAREVEELQARDTYASVPLLIRKI